MPATRRRTRKALWHWLFGVAATLVTLAGWSELLTKPLLAYREQHDSWAVLRRLLTGDGIYDGWAEGYLFLLLTLILLAILVYAISRASATINGYIDKSRVDLSILQTRIRVYVEDVDMRRAQIRREQLFHANAPDVQAYHYSHTPDAGRVVHGSFNIETTVADEVVTSDTEAILVSGGKGIEITEMYSGPLPTSFFTTYLSDRWVLALHKAPLRMFRKVLAYRAVSFISEGEYDQDEPRYQLQLLRYPAHEVSFEISFPGETAPDLCDIRILRIRENAATPIKPSYVPHERRMVLSFSVYDADNERVRVRWSNTRLKQYLASRQAPKRKGLFGRS